MFMNKVVGKSSLLRMLKVMIVVINVRGGEANNMRPSGPQMTAFPFGMDHNKMFCPRDHTPYRKFWFPYRQVYHIGDRFEH